jgi:hypothetical protein
MKTQTLYGSATDVVVGSSLKGYIKTTRATIETIFGQPTYENPFEDKITTEWVVELIDENGDSVIATIYDWKRYEMGKPASDEVIYWHIGGFSNEATDKVAEALGVEAFSSSYPIWLDI